jgi:ABC-type enterochelin transport system substrate-binding protein
MLKAAEHVLHPNQNERLRRQARRNDQSAESVLRAVDDLFDSAYVSVGRDNAKTYRAIEAVHACMIRNLGELDMRVSRNRSGLSVFGPVARLTKIFGELPLSMLPPRSIR